MPNQLFTLVNGSLTTASVDNSIYSDPATNGNTYRWEDSSQQYFYNWSTRNLATSFYYRIGVAFDDGRTYYMNIGLR